MANYVLLERIELNASAASVTFSNIPQTGYTDLKIVMSARTTSNVSGQTTNYVDMLINNDSGAYYDQRNVSSTFGGSITNQSWTNQNSFYVYQIDASTATANTFSNTEIYIPNAFGTTAKSISTDGAAENNISTGSDRALALAAGLYHPATNTGISSLKFTPGSGSGDFAQYSTFSLYGLAAVGTTPAIAPKASGGNITTDGTYWYHTFLASGTFTPAIGLSCDVLVVAGGGGGGANYGAGGGAGGLLTFTSQSIAASAQTVTVGAGGPSAPSNTRGSAGSNSVFGSLTACVGGGGGGGNSAGQYNGGSGGSGGGGGGLGGSNATGGSGTSGQGNAGANQTGAGASSGGGGAGAAGSGVNPGIGATSALINAMGAATNAGELSGGNYYFAGGGLGYSAGTRALGGGAPITGSGTVNTGGGGGGDGYSVSKGGGSGIVIVRYPIA